MDMKRSQWLIGLTLGIGLVGCSDQARRDRQGAEAEYKLGQEIMAYDAATELPAEPSHYMRALQHFEQAMAADSTFAPAYAAAVVPYYSRFWWNEVSKSEAEAKSRWALSRAQQHGPRLSETLTAEAVMRMLEGDMAASEPVFKRAIEADPNSWNARREYASMLGRSGRFQEALAEAQPARDADPLAILPCEVLAGAYHNLDRLDESVTTWRECIALNTMNQTAYPQLAVVLIEKGDYDGAIAVADESIAVGQDRPWIRNVRSWALAMNGDLEAALAGYEGTEYQGGIGWVNALMGNRAEAQQAVERMTAALDGTEWWHHFDIGLVLAALGDVEVGIDHLEAHHQKLIENTPQDVVGYGRALSRFPEYAFLRDHPRVKALIARTGYVSPT